jgi:hypothetical protein
MAELVFMVFVPIGIQDGALPKKSLKAPTTDFEKNAGSTSHRFQKPTMPSVAYLGIHMRRGQLLTVS